RYNTTCITRDMEFSSMTIGCNSATAREYHRFHVQYPILQATAESSGIQVDQVASK
ncbi:hypothetical protein L195_g023740, partial [Trifolium pratense]